jgi:hypothetical protein
MRALRLIGIMMVCWAVTSPRGQYRCRLPKRRVEMAPRAA